MKNNELIQLYLDEKKKIIENLSVDEISKVVELIWGAYKNNKTVYAFANGGPAGLIGNLTCDLANHPFVMEDKSKTYPEDMRRLKVRNLVVDPSVLTGISNDLGYEEIFARQLQTEVKEGDVVIGISGSGNSKNVIRAFEVAKKYGAYTVLISRGRGGSGKNLADICILVPGSSKYPGQTGTNDNNFHFEDFIVSITHMITGILCERVKEAYEKGNYDIR
jgi:D-sedoheptulose 7-phosphate isomerase